jgi:hypothetical protein
MMTMFPGYFEQVAARLGLWPEPPVRRLANEQHEDGRETEALDPDSPIWIDPSEGQRAASWAFSATAPDQPVTAFSLNSSPDLMQQPDPDGLSDDMLRIDFMDRKYGRKPTTDFVAAYRPWHVHGRRWGVYFDGPHTLALSAATARSVGEPLWRIAPLVLRQVYSHELVHFAFEVAGMQIEDVIGRPRYVAYLHNRYSQMTAYGPGPLEEAVASYAEIAFSRSAPVKRAGLSSSVYEAVVARHLRASGPGYRDFGLMTPKSRGHQVVAEVAGTIADRSLSTGRWVQVSTAEKRQVPLYWVGDPSGLAITGGLPKTVSPPTIRQTEKWLRAIGAELNSRGGKGSHAKVRLPSGATVSYARGRGVLLPPEAKKLAEAVGLRNERALFVAISEMAVPPPSTT